MKKFTLLAILAILCSSICFAQSRRSSKMDNVGFAEFEVGLGPIWGSNYQYGDSQTGFQGFVEARLNLNSPIDVGLQCSMGKFNRKYENESTKGYTWNKICVLGFFDYNFRILPDVAPFIGIGAGGSSSEIYYKVANENSASSFDTEKSGRFVLCPRIGVELISHLRVTLEYKFMASSKYNYGGINIGWAFGGGNKYDR